MSATAPLAFKRELLRIGVDLADLGGLATSGGVSAEDFLAWLRGIPTNLGHQGFLDHLATAGPTPGLAHNGLPPADPAFRAPDLDLLEEFQAELDRVLPADLRNGFGVAIVASFDMNAAVRALRTLPDRAGWEAVVPIIPISRVIDTSG